MQTRVVLADMTQLLREIVRSVVSSEDDLSIVAEVTDPRDLVRTAMRERANVLIVGDEHRFREAWNDALETIPRLRVLAVVQDGRRGCLHELRPRHTPLGTLSAESLLASVRSAPP